MLYYVHRPRRSHWLPQYSAATVADIDFAQLHGQGVRACLIDLDGTVVARGQFAVSAATKRAMRAAPMPVYIATNRPRSRSLKNLRADLRANGVVHPRGIWAKPSKKYYQMALAELHLQPSTTVMVGDRYLQDVWGANRAGLQTVLVTHRLGSPRGVAERVLHTLETWLTRRMRSRYRPLADT